MIIIIGFLSLSQETMYFHGKFIVDYHKLSAEKLEVFFTRHIYKEFPVYCYAQKHTSNFQEKVPVLFFNILKPLLELLINIVTLEPIRVEISAGNKLLKP